MTSIELKIQEKLKQLSPDHFELENESHKHGFSRGPEGHFKLLLVSKIFENMRTIERHQKIYGVLKDEMAEGVHALAIKALTPAEYAALGGNFQSPPCAHKNDASS